MGSSLAGIKQVPSQKIDNPKKEIQADCVSSKTDLLKEKAAWLRKEMFEMVVRAKKGHFPSSSSCTELIISLFYGNFMRFRAKEPKWAGRDRLFISKGHAGMALYPILVDLGFVAESELPKFTKVDGIFRFYPDPSIPGIEAITGSLGHGLGIAAGHAFAAKKDGLDNRSFVILGDGELYEGSTWETALFAAHHNLNNLVVIVDRNGCCIMDHTENCIRLDPIEEKWAAFGWHAVTIDGHDLDQINAILEKATSGSIKQPIAIVANTIKGKGISYMENKAGWHNRMPTAEEILIGRNELGITA